MTIFRKRFLIAAITGACLAALPVAHSAQAWVGVGIGITPAPVYAYPPPAYYPYPAPAPAPYYPYPAAAPVAAPPPPPPSASYNDGDYHDCREYSRKVVINGQNQNVYGHACRQPDGEWKIMD